MIRFADKNDYYKIRELWDIAFPEDKNFNDYFFENIFDINTVLILTENNNLISMAQMIPYKIKELGDVTYIYGAATSPQYRGQGRMKKLLEESFEIDKKLGRKASILIPAEKSLFEYYKRTGYETAFYIDKIDTVNTNLYRYNFRKAEYSDINNMIDIYNGDVVRDYEYFNKQIDMFRNLGGEVFVLYDNNKLLSYSFVWNNEIIEIQEICGSENQYLANYVMKYYNKNKAKANFMKYGQPFGMIKYHTDYSKLIMYMNLMYN